MHPPTETSVSSTPAPRFGSRVDRDVELVITRGRARNRVRSVVAPVFMIGTAPDCDLVLGDDRFPEVHAYLLVGQGPILLRWLGLDPEITVNGARVDHVSLRDMDRIRTGPYEFLVRIEEKRRKGPLPHRTIPAPHMQQPWTSDALSESPGVFDPTAEAAAVLADQLEQIETALQTSGASTGLQTDDLPVLRVYRGPSPGTDKPASDGKYSENENTPPWPRWPMNHQASVS